jgi:hypothetical protein
MKNKLLILLFIQSCYLMAQGPADIQKQKLQQEKSVADIQSLKQAKSLTNPSAIIERIKIVVQDNPQLISLLNKLAAEKRAESLVTIARQIKTAVQNLRLQLQAPVMAAVNQYLQLKKITPELSAGITQYTTEGKLIGTETEDEKAAELKSQAEAAAARSVGPGPDVSYRRQTPLFGTLPLSGGSHR